MQPSLGQWHFQVPQNLKGSGDSSGEGVQHQLLPACSVRRTRSFRHHLSRPSDIYWPMTFAHFFCAISVHRSSRYAACLNPRTGFWPQSSVRVGAIQISRFWFWCPPPSGPTSRHSTHKAFTHLGLTSMPRQCLHLFIGSQSSEAFFLASDRLHRLAAQCTPRATHQH